MEEKLKSRKASRKKKEKKIILFLFFIVVIVLITCLIVFIPKLTGNSVGKKLIGTWTTDGITIYEFKTDGIGALKLPLSEYEFSYKIEGNNLFIDYKNEKSIDSSYEISFENKKLILKGINKTSGTYTFTKNEN